MTIHAYGTGLSIATEYSTYGDWWRWRVFVTRTGQVVYSGRARTEQRAIEVAQAHIG